MSSPVAPEDDLDALLARVLRPRWTQLPAALDAVREQRDPDALWESLAGRGLIPAHWVGDTSRAFDPCSPNDAPRSVGLAVAFAAAPSLVVTAEQLAREVVATLGPWGLPGASELVWKALAPSAQRGGDVRAVPSRRGSGPLQASGYHASTAFYGADPTRYTADAVAQRAVQDAIRTRLRGDRLAAVAGLQADLWGRSAWRIVCEMDCSVPALSQPDTTSQPAAVGRLLRALRCPYDPLLALWSLGVALSIDARGRVVLWLPEPAPETASGDEASLAYLARRTETKRARQRAAAVAELAERAGASAIPRLRESLLDREERVRGQAALALGRLGDAASIPALVALVSAENGPDRREVARGLTKLGAVEAVPALARMLGCGLPRDATAAACALLGQAPVVALMVLRWLGGIARDAAPEVARGAAAQGALPGPRAERSLWQLGQAEDALRSLLPFANAPTRATFERAIEAVRACRGG